MSPVYFRPLAVCRLYSLVLLGQPAVDTPGTEKETTSGVTWTAAGVEVELFCCGCSVLLRSVHIIPSKCTKVC